MKTVLMLRLALLTAALSGVTLLSGWTTNPASAVTLELSGEQTQPFLMTVTGESYLVADWDTGELYRYPRQGDPQKVASPLARFWQPGLLTSIGKTVWSLDRVEGSLFRFHPDGNLIAQHGASGEQDDFSEVLSLAPAPEGQLLLLRDDRVELRSEELDLEAELELSEAVDGGRLVPAGEGALLVELPGATVSRLSLDQDGLNLEPLELNTEISGAVTGATALPSHGAFALISQPASRDEGASLTVCNLPDSDTAECRALSVPLDTPRTVVHLRDQILAVLDSSAGKIYEFKIPDQILQ